MRKYLTILLMFAVIPAAAQLKDLRRGNREFRKGEYGQADISYRKGLLKDSTSIAARYNLANNLYRQGNFDEAAKQMDAVPQDSLKKCPFAADFFFNRGNVAIAQEDWNKAVESYISCLMLTPDDMAAKENYTYARYHLQDNQNQDQGGDNNQDQNQDKQDQDKDKDQNQQNQQNGQNQDNQNQNQNQQQPQPVEISPQQAQQMLQAIQEKERETQEKVDEKKAAALRSRQKEKNW
ncbi:MAG: hypothetical protein J5835_00260 [Bacteroidales bacterium]|nr:hypothetical protein [Bacteroidales bacterium]